MLSADQMESLSILYIVSAARALRGMSFSQRYFQAGVQLPLFCSFIVLASCEYIYVTFLFFFFILECIFRAQSQNEWQVVGLSNKLLIEVILELKFLHVSDILCSESLLQHQIIFMKCTLCSHKA